MTLVLLHGAYGAAADWDDVVAALRSSTSTSSSAGAVRPLTVPGHGREDAVPVGVDVDVDDGWQRAVAVLEARLADLPVIHLAGYSLGARLALALAQRPSLRDRLQSLTLVAGTAGLDDDDARARRRAIDDERASWLASDPDAFLEAFWRLPLFASLDRYPDKAVRLAERQARARAHPVVLAWWMRCLSVGRQPSLWSSLSTLSVPTTIIVGSLDDDYVAHGERLRSLLPRARLTVVHGAGHALLLEAPIAVANAIANAMANATAVATTEGVADASVDDREPAAAIRVTP